MQIIDTNINLYFQVSSKEELYETGIMYVQSFCNIWLEIMIIFVQFCSEKEYNFCIREN